jgi:hypothetical protein
MLLKNEKIVKISAIFLIAMFLFSSVLVSAKSDGEVEIMWKEKQGEITNFIKSDVPLILTFQKN